MLLCNCGFSQIKNNAIEFQLGGIKSIPLAGFINNRTELNGGQPTSFVSVLLSHKIKDSNFFLMTGINWSFKNARFQQNLDTLTYSGFIYTQPKYRIISIPFMISFSKQFGVNFNPISKRKKAFSFSNGFSVDFVKEFSIKNGMKVTGKGFSINSSYKNNFSFLAKTGISFNSMLSLPIYQFKNGKSLFFVGAYKYPFYKQKNISINYTINTNPKSYEIYRLRLQEISFGLSLKFSK